MLYGCCKSYVGLIAWRTRTIVGQGLVRSEAQFYLNTWPVRESYTVSVDTGRLTQRSAVHCWCAISLCYLSCDHCRRPNDIERDELTCIAYVVVMSSRIAALLLCLIGGLAGDGRGARGGGGQGGGGGGVVDEGIRANCTTRLMSADISQRKGYLSVSHLNIASPGGSP